MENAVEVNEKCRDISLENMLNLNIGETYRVQIGHVMYEGLLEGFVAETSQQKIAPSKISLRNGFVFDLRYLGTDWEVIIPFVNKVIDYRSFSVKSYKKT